MIYVALFQFAFRVYNHNCSNNTKLQVQIFLPPTFGTYDHEPKDSSKHGPPKSHESYNSTFRLAVLLHPYGPLGGCKDDGVISCVSLRLREIGYLVSTPNMRGVGLSKGKTSWTGRSECEDLYSLVSLFLDVKSKARWDDEQRSILSVFQKQKCTEILIIGYSYGAMIASSFNQSHVKSFANSGEGLSMSSMPKMRTVLLSYPVSVTWALSLWKSNQFSIDLTNLLLQAQAEENEAGRLKVLIVFGHQDQFSSASSFKKWLANNMVFSLKTSLSEVQNNCSDSNVLTIYNSQADHFWRHSVLLTWLATELTTFLEL